MHASAHPEHELLIEQWAKQTGFAEISVSHRVSSSEKMISRGDTTLVNAYLNPVLKNYIASIKQSLPGSQLKLMTSTGGLVAADHFMGKDSILSGPAGGVVGFANAAKKLGYSRSIGFDMGGTSTDILTKLIESQSLAVVQNYMQHIREAAAKKTRLALGNLDAGEYKLSDTLDDGSPICVAITISDHSATVDFSGTGPVLQSNLNASRAIVTAAVLYVFRCLIAEDIPLNEGVLEPIDLILPECLLNPPAFDDPARCVAMVGGNVETSQRIVDVLLGALQLAAASQGTMNNLTFGDDTFGYYETICGGSGATSKQAGTDAVHTHMTNTRLTDAEVIERKYPVRIQSLSIRKKTQAEQACTLEETALFAKSNF